MRELERFENSFNVDLIGDQKKAYSAFIKKYELKQNLRSYLLFLYPESQITPSWSEGNAVLEALGSIDGIRLRPREKEIGMLQCFFVSIDDKTFEYLRRFREGIWIINQRTNLRTSKSQKLKAKSLPSQ